MGSYDASGRRIAVDGIDIANLARNLSHQYLLTRSLIDIDIVTDRSL